MVNACQINLQLQIELPCNNAHCAAPTSPSHVTYSSSHFPPIASVYIVLLSPLANPGKFSRCIFSLSFSNQGSLDTWTLRMQQLRASAMAMTRSTFLLMLIATALLATQHTTAQTTSPVSISAPYSTTITAGKTKIILATGNYIVSLESSPCAITVRHLFSNPIGHLFWTANYFVGSLVGATQCTLTFTTNGDLQLTALFQGSTTMIWHSNTAGKGISKMVLENNFDSGEFQLLTAGNVVKYSSFGVKEFSILPTQKLRFGESLVAPDAVFNDNKQQVLFSGGRYFLKLESGDLRLYSDFGNGQKQYWSLKRTTIPTKDLSLVAYASIVTGVGGIGLFKSNGALVWTSGKIGYITSNPHDTYFGVDPDGNLRTYALVKGQYWGQDFVAIPSICDLPNSCGEYGVCSNNVCGCLPNWVPVKANDKTQGCKTLAPFVNCGSGRVQFLSFTGYDYVYNQYAAGVKVPIGTCETKCYADCKCLAYFYNANTGVCYLSNEVRTLKKVPDAKKSVHIKI